MDKLKELLSKDSIYEYENINKNSKQINASVFLPVVFKNGDYGFCYSTKKDNQVSWTQETPEISMNFIERCGISKIYFFKYS